MRKRNLLFAILPLLALSTLTGCSNDAVPLKKGDTIFTKRAYIDGNNIPKKLQIKIDIEGKIKHITIGTRLQIFDDSFTYKNGILSIDGRVFMNRREELALPYGDQTIKITADKAYRIPFLVATKILRTVQDLYTIEDKPFGAYLMGNDIDLSSVDNWEPLFNFDMPFIGIFDGNGYAIKNMNCRYSNDATSNAEPLFNNEFHNSGDQFGFFQNVGGPGTIRNTAFLNCDVVGRTITGIVAGNNGGQIYNVFVDEESSAKMGTHFYDDNCNVAAICGINAGVVSNCLSLANLSISNAFTNKNPNEDPMYFAGGAKGFADSNGKNANGVYAGVGMSFGEVKDCLARKYIVNQTGLTISYAQYHMEINKPKDGPDIGSVRNCDTLTMSELKTKDPYIEKNFDEDIWKITGDSIPTFKGIYPYYIY